MSVKKPEWTKSQITALRRRGNTIVSAAAGSGKTTVMTEKIVRLLRRGASLSEMLVVTFARAAASQLREKIRENLAAAAAGGDKSAEEHLAALPLAEIGTIHTFCARTIRENFSLAEVPADFSIAEGSTVDILKEKAVNEAMDDLFDESPDEAWGITSVCDVIGKTKEPRAAAEALIYIYDVLRESGYDENKLLEEADLLEKSAEKDYLTTPWGEAVVEASLTVTDHYVSVLKEIIEGLRETEKAWQARGQAASDRYEHAVALREALLARDYERTFDITERTTFKGKDRLSKKDATDATELFDYIMDPFGKDMKDLKKNFFAETQETITDAMKRTAYVLRAVSRAIGAYAETYTRLKRNRGKLDFQDLEILAHRLLVDENGEPTETALHIGKKYKYIFIDEYQDTNRIQDEIFRAVSAGGNAERFLVGDVKQAIYRFRGAEPEIFSGYRERWPAIPPVDGDADGDDVCEPRDAGVFMSDNFRCSRPIVRFANCVSEFMFSEGAVPFGIEDRLVPATNSDVNSPVEVRVLENRTKEVCSPPEEEYVAERIKEMIGTDPFGEGTPLKPADFAVLLRSASGKTEKYVSALTVRGIPVSNASGVSMADRPEVEFALDLLRAVDNPHRDIPLANVMMSSLFSFTLDEMVTVRRNHKSGSLYSAVLAACENGDGALSRKCASFCDRMKHFRETERSLSAAVFIERLFGETGIARSPEVTSVMDGEKHVRFVLDMARSYESSSWGGLYGFLQYWEERAQGGGLNTSSGGSEGVTVTTVHGAKGLEWPVVFFSGTATALRKTQDGNLFYGRDLGWSMRLPDPGGLVLCSTPLMAAVDAKESVGTNNEELRLIYVALTRAIHKLIVVAKPPKSSSDTLLKRAEMSARLKDKYTLEKLPSEIDYILAAMNSHAEKVADFDTIGFPADEDEAPAEEAPAAEMEEAPAFDPEKVAALVDSTEKRFAAEYPYSFLSGIPSKLSVSRLYPDVLSPEDGVADLEKEEEEQKRDGPMPVPSFMTGSAPVTGRDRGIATHSFLQFADFARLGSCRTEDEIARLRENGFISERDAALVVLPEVEKFKESPLFRRIAGARRVWREFRFNVLLPAEKFTSDPERAEKFAGEGVKITVQGVFDCVFEDAEGKLVVADYKTDRMTKEDRADPAAWIAKLRERHALQLRYYREAATLLFGRDPDEVLIYSLPLGDTVDMKNA